MLKIPEFFTDPHELSATPHELPILVALSGGADSSALLHILHADAQLRGYGLYAVHVNHGIRTADYGDEAARDERFCKQMCDGLGVTLFTEQVDVPTIASETGKSLETAARDARYAIFKKIMSQNGIRLLATAHNADDNLETQIFNLARGCGLDGISGIPRTREIGDGTVVRPILSASKTEITEFCKLNGIKYVIDSTNLEDECTRNRIRHRIIPELYSIFGSPQRASLRLAERAREDNDCLNGTAEDFLSKHGGRLPASELSELHPAIAARVFIMAFAQIADASLEQVHVRAALDMIRSGKSGSSISLPDGKYVTVLNGHAVFGDGCRTALTSVKEYSSELCRGLNFIDGTKFAIELTDRFDGTERKNIDGKAFAKYASAELYGIDISRLRAKSRQSGDRILDGGVHKRIKKLMCDRRVDIGDRDVLPIIMLDGEPIYVPLCAVADMVKKKSGVEMFTIVIYKEITEEQR